MTCTIRNWSPREEGSFLLCHIPNETYLLKLINLKTNTFNFDTVNRAINNVIEVEIERSSVQKVVMPSAATISRLKLKQTYLSDITLEVGNEWLSFLTITDSRMKSVPATMAHLVVLEMLEISKSSIETVNLNLFSKLTHLRLLNLCDNKILFLHLSDAAEGNFAQLRDLFISGNLLTTIDLRWFSNMKLLQTLDLHRNRIRRMQGALVSNSLKFLDLSENRIETLNCCEWNITSLNRFMLSSNELVTLPSCLPLTMPNVMYLILQRNAYANWILIIVIF